MAGCSECNSEQPFFVECGQKLYNKDILEPLIFAIIGVQVHTCDLSVLRYTGEIEKEETILNRLKEVLNNQGDNYILPFFWQHGETEELLREL